MIMHDFKYTIMDSRHVVVTQGTQVAWPVFVEEHFSVLALTNSKDWQSVYLHYHPAIILVYQCGRNLLACPRMPAM
jgi:hypothetical protein